MAQKIPAHAKSVFKGMFFEIFQWDQKCFDGSVGTWELAVRPDTLAVIAVKGDKIVVSKESQPFSGAFTTLISGCVENGELALTAAKRELLEESGLVSDDWELFNEYTYSHKLICTGHCFIARNCRKVADASPEAYGEKIKNLELSFDEFLEFVLRDDFRNKEVALDVAKMRLHPNQLKVFKKKLFGAR
jgi:ADP-ribose pyrophosphatase